MKKIFLTLVALTTFTFALNAQPFAKGDHVINVGIGIGQLYYGGWGGAYHGNLPVMGASYEYGIVEVPMGSDLTGVVSVGGIFTYTGGKYDYWDDDYYVWTSILFAARSNYHCIFHDKLDTYAGGFSEYSEEGAKLEKEVLRIAKKWGIRIVGPNGIGIINIENGFVVAFPPLNRKAVRKGKVSLLVQSGGVSLTYLNLISSASVGISKIVSMGNKLVLNEIDFLKYLIHDPQTAIIGIYLVSIQRGRDLLEIARSTTKPIILHKANTGEASKEIAKLHTAALANDDKIVETALKQADIIRARDFRSFINAVKVLSLPPMKGNDLVILSCKRVRP